MWLRLAGDHPTCAAVCRPGRFDLVLYVPPPDEAGRLQALQVGGQAGIRARCQQRHTHCMQAGMPPQQLLTTRWPASCLQIHSRAIPLASDVDLTAIAACTQRYTGVTWLGAQSA